MKISITKLKNKTREIGIEWVVFKMCRHLKKSIRISSNDKLQKVSYF